MTIVWSPGAERDLDAIFDYVLNDDPAAAERLCDRIEARVLELEDYPQIGRPGRTRGTRELVVPGTPYIAIYRIGVQRIDVLAVIHGARARR